MKTRQLLIVVMFLFAFAVPIRADDHAASVDSLKTRAAQGEAKAQLRLGVMYAKGEGGPQDDTEAVKWFNLAAAQGLAQAQVNLGVMYDEGHGVPQDHAQALKWYRLAAAQGHAEAQYNLGLQYATGQGVPKDYVQAHKWLTLAAATFTDKPKRDLAEQSCDDVAILMTPAQIAEAQKPAREWKKQ